MRGIKIRFSKWKLHGGKGIFIKLNFHQILYLVYGIYQSFGLVGKCCLVISNFNLVILSTEVRKPCTRPVQVECWEELARA